MALSKLKTDWKTIGSSGLTVDGRTISPDVLKSAAETYDPEFYAALMFPDHDRYFSPNFGKIEAVRAVNNEDGSTSLQAIIAPNENYIYANRQGQFLYSSMELRADFPERGKFYLVGCAPTDNPASTRTAEIRFSAQEQPILIGSPVETILGDLQSSEKTSLFARLFTRPHSEDDMNPKQLETLLARLDGIEAKLTAAPNPDPKPEDGEPGKDPAGDPPEPEEEVVKLTARLEKIEALAANQQAMADQLKALRDEFTAALNNPDPNGTKPPKPAETGGARAFL